MNDPHEPNSVPYQNPLSEINQRFSVTQPLFMFGLLQGSTSAKHSRQLNVNHLKKQQSSSKQAS